jgi:23S rRNA (guanosine2251-2'-O)-methyltransferase
MAGNSQRRGAVRNPGSKKGAQVGTGGKGRRALEGRGPTPKAEERTKHPAAARAAAAARRGATGRPSAAAAAGSRAGAPRAAGPRGRGLRSGSGTEVVAGRNPVVEALRAGIPASSLHLADRLEGAGSDDRVREALQIAGDRGLPVLETTRGDLDRLADGAVHQGVVLKVPPYEYAALADVLAAADDAGEPALVVALDSVTDPHNLGAVVRSAAAFGAHGVLVPERRSAGMTASAWKVSAGAAARLPVARETNLTRALGQAQEQGCFVVGLDADGDAVLGDEQVARLAQGPLVVVVGSEGKGLSRLVRSTCDLVVSIPMAGRVESLNASVAAGVALYAVASARAAADRLR